MKKMRINCSDGTVSATEHEIKWLIANHKVQAMSTLLFFNGSKAELNSLLATIPEPKPLPPVPNPNPGPEPKPEPKPEPIPGLEDRLRSIESKLNQILYFIEATLKADVSRAQDVGYLKVTK